MTRTDKREAMKAIGEVFRHENAMRDAIAALPARLDGKVDLRRLGDRLDEETHGLSTAYAELESEVLAATGSGAIDLHEARIGTARTPCHAIVVDDEAECDAPEIDRQMEDISELLSKRGTLLGDEDNAVILVTGRETRATAVAVLCGRIADGDHNNPATVLLAHHGESEAECVFGGLHGKPGEKYPYEVRDAMKNEDEAEDA